MKQWHTLYVLLCSSVSVLPCCQSEHQEHIFSEILFKRKRFSFKEIHFEKSTVKWRPFYLGISVLKQVHVLLPSVLFCSVLFFVDSPDPFIHIRQHCFTALWRHQMEIFSALLSLCAGNPPVTGGFPTQQDRNAELWCIFVISLGKLLNQHAIDR